MTNNELLDYLGLDRALEGVPDELQKCQNPACGKRAARTIFTEINQPGPADGSTVRMWLCDGCADDFKSFNTPPPIGATVFQPGVMPDAIPRELWESMRQRINRELDSYVRRKNLTRSGNVEYMARVIVKKVRGKKQAGTELLGVVNVGRKTG